MEKTNEKEKIVLELTKFDEKIDEYIPEYKERFNIGKYGLFKLSNWYSESSSVYQR